MLDRTYPEQVCSVARALDVVGERWTHKGCGGKVNAALRCARCRRGVAFADLELRPGPG